MEEGLALPSQPHKTHTQKQALQPALSMRTGCRRSGGSWQLMNSALAGASMPDSVLPSSLAGCCACLCTPLPLMASPSCSFPSCCGLMAKVGESGTQDQKCQESDIHGIGYSGEKALELESPGFEFGL